MSRAAGAGLPRAVVPGVRPVPEAPAAAEARRVSAAARGLACDPRRPACRLPVLRGLRPGGGRGRSPDRPRRGRRAAQSQVVVSRVPRDPDRPRWWLRVTVEPRDVTCSCSLVGRTQSARRRLPCPHPRLNSRAFPQVSGLFRTRARYDPRHANECANAPPRIGVCWVTRRAASDACRQAVARGAPATPRGRSGGRPRGRLAKRGHCIGRAAVRAIPAIPCSRGLSAARGLPRLALPLM